MMPPAINIPAIPSRNQPQFGIMSSLWSLQPIFVCDPLSDESAESLLDFDFDFDFELDLDLDFELDFDFDFDEIEGLSDGLTDGDFDGSTDGEAVGSDDGPDVGLCDGELDGL